MMALAIVGAAACQAQTSPLASPSSSPPPAASPAARPSPIALRAPAEAILTDADTGLPRSAGRDHLKVTEVARDQSDPRGALATIGGWGWVDESTRSWAAADRRVETQVLLTLRADGARQAYGQWVQETDSPPRTGSPCPPDLAGLDDCRVGRAGAVAVVVGRLDSVVFRVAGTNVDTVALAAIQARRLGAT
jgi:hypothetical protein